MTAKAARRALADGKMRMLQRHHASMEWHMWAPDTS
eukprot:CAMPEP_0177254686 /NCGR_PEP_ID=MMETSP0367-20130122/55924_1 /TAXON_ID=447022 ORGANISM="Scrippsiella hangoei-like, Strain SHHI-4" /NCGR_SAMPLE_ID=MMETSP0367 /ASSEMBLY_ACC=CAM_ASM_000362 /LENGTH=35 /DNA_ID= /DNA_START= /DNA_END= /DNA_ORIENTATION=